MLRSVNGKTKTPELEGYLQPGTDFQVIIENVKLNSTVVSREAMEKSWTPTRKSHDQCRDQVNCTKCLLVSEVEGRNHVLFGRRVNDRQTMLAWNRIAGSRIGWFSKRS